MRNYLKQHGMGTIMTAVAAVCLVWAANVMPAAAAKAKETVNTNWIHYAVTPNWNPGPEYADDVRMFQGIASMARAPQGRLWATWYGGGLGEGEANFIMLATSGDDGKTWSPLKAVIDPPFRASEPALWLDPTGRLWFMWNQYPEGLQRENSSLWAMTTKDPDSENPTWSAPRELAFPNINNFNKPTVLSDGRWLWPAGSWNRNVLSRPLFSSDQGETFVPGGEIPMETKDRNFEEYQVVERRDGSLWLLTRTSYGTIGESVSTDGGKTWSDVKPSDIQHTRSRFFITRLESGKLLLVKHGPVDPAKGIVPQFRDGRKELMAFLSDDDGKTWSDGLMLDERDQVSYPDGLQAPDGTMYVIYDYQRHGAKEILMAVFTEADIAAGECVSDKARLRVLVNKATGQDPSRGPDGRLIKK
jgi:predicted neuraminidase